MLFDFRNKNYIFVLKKIKTEVGGFVGIEEEELENCSNNIEVIKSYSDKSGTVLLANIPYSYALFICLSSSCLSFVGFVV